MLDLARDDTRQVHVRVTATLGIAVLYLTQLPFAKLLELTNWWTVVLLVGLGSLVIAAGLYFWYTEKVHLSRVEIASCLQTQNAARARQAWVRTWDANRWFFWGGDVFFVAGIVLLALVLVQLFT
jgi:hypothetical protein